VYLVHVSQTGKCQGDAILSIRLKQLEATDMSGLSLAPVDDLKLKMADVIAETRSTRDAINLAECLRRISIRH
jgi:hypothetical protein